VPPVLNSVLQTCFSLVIGVIGAAIANLLHLPLPFLLGAFLASIVASIADISFAGLHPKLPMPFRNLFVTVIGVAIGGTFRPDLFDHLSGLILPLIGVVIFVILAFLGNYLLFRRFGRYDQETAFFSAMPGGLIEAVALADTAGAKTEIVSLQQFSRIALVITTIPFLFLVVTGHTVGSQAGLTLAGRGMPNLPDALILLVCALLGLYGGRAIRLPAALLVGPMLLSAIAHTSGLTDAGPPGWLISVAQVIIGAGLGARYRGFKLHAIRKAGGLAVLSVGFMLVLGVIIAAILHQITAQNFGALFISYAPGGVTETALIALSLGANPVFVTSLHVARILLTVVISGWFVRQFARKRARTSGR